MTCGEETFNDQVWFFAEEEGVKEFGQKKLEEKILLMGMKYEKKISPECMDCFLHRSEFCGLEQRG